MNDLERNAAQAVFYAALAHIAEQGRPAIVENIADPEYGDVSVRCTYAGGPGGKLGCAFAPAIKTLTRRIERLGAIDIIENYPEALHSWAKHCPGPFAQRVQNAHDSAAHAHRPEKFPHLPEEECNAWFMCEFRDRMRRIAEDPHYAPLRLSV